MQPEAVAMQLPRRRQRPLIAEALKGAHSPAAALAGPIRQLSCALQAGGQALQRRRDVEQHPVHPRACRGIGVVDHECIAHGAARSAVPVQRRREVQSLAAVQGGDPVAIGEGR